MPGPVPKRSDQRRRRNAPQFGLDKVAGAAVVAPELGIDVHPLAADWFAALSEGSEALYYTPAIWQRARVVADMLSRLLASSRPSSQMYAAIQNDMKSLLVDAGELRRLGIEVQAAEPSAGAEVIDWRGRASASS
jgi:hypothetical protein